MYDDRTLQIIEYHRSMLIDEVRTTSFLRAILGAVKPGDVVLDMGCGTGVLSYFACIATSNSRTLQFALDGLFHRVFDV